MGLKLSSGPGDTETTHPGVSPHVNPTVAQECQRHRVAVQGWGSRAVSGTPTSPHTGVTGRHWPIRKIRFYFPSGCTCTTSIPRAMTLSPRSASTPAAHRPLPVQPRGAGIPLPGPAPLGSLGHRSVLPPHCRFQGQSWCGASLGLAAVTSGEQLPPSPLRSLGWRVRAPSASAAVSGGCCRTPAHLRDTRRDVTPRTFRQFPPRSLRLPCRERRESCRYHGVSGWGAPCSCPLSATPTPPWGPTVRWPVAHSWSGQTDRWGCA